MKYYYDGMTPYEEYPIDIDIECFNCKYSYECYSDDNCDETKTPRCLVEQLECEN
jgi:hypothetical protein